MYVQLLLQVHFSSFQVFTSVNLTGRPPMIFVKSEYTVAVEDSFSAECPTQQWRPQPVSVQWFRDSQAIATTDPRLVSLLEQKFHLQ